MCVVLIVVFLPGCDSTDDFAKETYFTAQKAQKCVLGGIIKVWGSGVYREICTLAMIIYFVSACTAALMISDFTSPPLASPLLQSQTL